MSKKSWTEDKLPESDELTLTIARNLEIDNQYVEFIGPVTSTASPRCGRQDGRQDGSSAGRSWPTQTSPNDEGRVTDIVAVREWPNEEKRATHRRARQTAHGRVLVADVSSEEALRLTRVASSSDLAGPAVNEHLVTGHEAGVVGGEEGDGLGEFLGAA